MPKFYTSYEPPPQVDYSNHEPSLTQQSFAEECDINNIVARYVTTGVLGDPLAVPTNSPQYGDFTSVADFHVAQTIIAEATQMFDLLPASIRKRFENDPAQLLAFMEDDSNREEAIKLGLVNSPLPNNGNPSTVSFSEGNGQAPTQSTTTPTGA